MDTKPSGLWIVVLCGVLAWIFAFRISVNPLMWEEPRRSVVALEMILGADYVVPHVLGQPYLNKPPLQNWLIVLLAGNDPGRIGAVPIRLISLLSILGTALLLWRLGRTLARPPGWTPALVFVTMGIVVQYGRSGELDALLTFWTLAAFCVFEVGRSRGSVWLQWVPSQVLLAGGILTKGVAPLFFYPPVLWLVWWRRRSEPFRLTPLLVGLGLEVALVLAWVVPYAQRSPVSALGRAWLSEVMVRTPVDGTLATFARHLAAYPFEIVVAVLPWSILLVPLGIPAVRRSVRGSISGEPVLQLALAVSIWSVGLFWLMPQARGRYLLPAFAMAALLAVPILSASVDFARTASRTFRDIWSGARAWIIVGMGWGVAVYATAVVIGVDRIWQPLLVGLVAIGAIAGVVRMEPADVSFRLILLVGLLYGVFYSGVSSVLRAEGEAPVVQAAEQIAASIDGALPVVCEASVSLRDCFVISRDLERVLSRNAPAVGEYLVVGSIEASGGLYGPALVEAPPFGLWRVRAE